MATREFKDAVESTAGRVLAALSAGGLPASKTAWDMKIELRVPHTMLHLALGLLIAQGRISVRPDGYTYSVEPLQPQTPA
ncbi:MAG: hypothetical protein HY922_12390 [Elusimicrobia bacterium]|nr:hypothetical protein [Elusimicrobiota bacterium]